MPATILARFLGNHKNDCAGVASRIARIPDLADFPLAADLHRDFLDISRADVRERDDRHLSARFRPHIRGDPLHPLHRVGLQDVSKIIHQPRRGRDLNAL